MPNPIAQKLKIKEGYSLLTINAPSDFKKDLESLPSNVTISDKAKDYDQVHWFVKDKGQMGREVKKSCQPIER